MDHEDFQCEIKTGTLKEEESKEGVPHCIKTLNEILEDIPGRQISASPGLFLDTMQLKYLRQQMFIEFDLPINKEDFKENAILEISPDLKAQKAEILFNSGRT